MPSELEQLEERVMRLSTKDREHLTRRLYSSLADEPSDPAWEAEIASRIRKLENGSAESRSIDDVFSEVKKHTA